jgi:hypothetical protein
MIKEGEIEEGTTAAMSCQTAGRYFAGTTAGGSSGGATKLTTTSSDVKTARTATTLLRLRINQP